LVFIPYEKANVYIVSDVALNYSSLSQSMPLEIPVTSLYLSPALVFPSQTNPDAQIAEY